MLLKLSVKDLRKFLSYLRGLGIEINEGPHTVLTDSSEVGGWYLLKDRELVGYVIAHYIEIITTSQLSQ